MSLTTRCQRHYFGTLLFSGKLLPKFLTISPSFDIWEHFKALKGDFYAWEDQPFWVGLVVLQVYDHCIELMTDPFGNYLMQKLVEYCNDEQRTIIAQKVWYKVDTVCFFWKTWSLRIPLSFLSSFFLQVLLMQDTDETILQFFIAVQYDHMHPISEQFFFVGKFFSVPPSCSDRMETFGFHFLDIFKCVGCAHLWTTVQTLRGTH